MTPGQRRNDSVSVTSPSGALSTVNHNLNRSGLFTWISSSSGLSRMSFSVCEGTAGFSTSHGAPLLWSHSHTWLIAGKHFSTLTWLANSRWQTVWSWGSFITCVMICNMGVIPGRKQRTMWPKVCGHVFSQLGSKSIKVTETSAWSNSLTFRNAKMNEIQIKLIHHLWLNRSYIIYLFYLCWIGSWELCELCVITLSQWQCWLICCKSNTATSPTTVTSVKLVRWRYCDNQDGYKSSKTRAGLTCATASYKRHTGLCRRGLIRYVISEFMQGKSEQIQSDEPFRQNVIRFFGKSWCILENTAQLCRLSCYLLTSTEAWALTFDASWIAHFNICCFQHLESKMRCFLLKHIFLGCGKFQILNLRQYKDSWAGFGGYQLN